jgi:dCMP deaminase
MKTIIIAYIPALHEGYIRFLQMYPKAELYLMTNEIIGELGKTTPYFSRDVRAIDPELMMKAIHGLGITPVSLLHKKAIQRFQIAEGLEIIMPTEDISIEFKKLYLPNQNVFFRSFFLRWDKLISQKELEVSPDRKVSVEDMDKELMGHAIQEAQRSSDWWRQIGSVLVKDGKIALCSYNEHMPHEQSPNVLGDARSNFDAGIRIELTTAIHSEVNLIAEAAKKGISTEGASIYITTFPCPPCARAIVKSGIKKVYYNKGYSLLDAEDILKHFGVELILVKME